MLRRVFILFLLFLLIGSCSQELKIKGSCDKENILSQCKKKYRRTIGRSTNIFIKENDSVFIVTFEPKDSTINRIGYTGFLVISKKNCKVIKGTFYQ